MAVENSFRGHPYTISTAYGRIFYGADNRIYFSQLFIDDLNSLGRCYQRNDPTSIEISDLLANDGGEILLQNSGRVQTIVEFQLGIIVFAEKGVWYIYGPDSGFSAESYAVEKVTDYKLLAPKGVQRYGDVLFYCAEEGLIALQANEFGRPQAQNISETTINKVWEDFVSSNITMALDRKNKQLHIVTRNNSDNDSEYNVLIFDIRTQAWYPQNINKGARATIAVDTPIYEEVTYAFSGLDVGGLARYTDTTFEDFGNSFESVLESAEETLGQFTKKKNVPNIYLMFKKTEENITSFNGTVFEYDNPSACNFSVMFDYAKTATGILSSQERQVYKVNRRGYLPPTSTLPAPLDDNRTVVEYRDMIRGSGKSVKFRFRSEPNKDMQVLGYSVEFSMRGRQ